MSGDKTQIYYEALVRTSHPAFARDFSLSSDVHSPLMSIINRVVARQLAKARAVVEEVRLNLYPSSVTLLSIDDWENEFFGFTKPSLALAQRVTELLIKVNKRFHMNVGDVIDLSRAIVGETPLITRNVYRDGWDLGRGALGISTSFGGGSGAIGFYLVSFTRPVDASLLAQLDKRLTTIEKAGSRHKVTAPVRHWILGRVPLGINSTLGA